MIGDKVLSPIGLRTTTEHLNIFHQIFTEISQFDNMKVIIPIFDIFLLLFKNNITSTIE